MSIQTIPDTKCVEVIEVIEVIEASRAPELNMKHHPRGNQSIHQKHAP